MFNFISLFIPFQAGKFTNTRENVCLLASIEAEDYFPRSIISGASIRDPEYTYIYTYIILALERLSMKQKVQQKKKKKINHKNSFHRKIAVR